MTVYVFYVVGKTCDPFVVYLVHSRMVGLRFDEVSDQKQTLVHFLRSESNNTDPDKEILFA